MYRSISLSLCGLLALATVAAAQPKIVTSKQVNGTWKSKFGTLKVLALGNQKLQVEFKGIYPYKLADGTPMANMGTGAGIARIEAQTAVFKPEGAEAACAISMQFSDGLLKVKQQSNCGFGNNVSATGTYRRVDSSKPKFGEDGI